MALGGTGAKWLVWDRCPTGGGTCATLANNLLPGSGVGYPVLQLYEVLGTGEMLGFIYNVATQSTLPQGIYLAMLALAGDFNHDSKVNAADLAILLGAWGISNSIEIDLSENGTVESADLGLLLGLWSGDLPLSLKLPCSGELCPLHQSHLPS
ncbi:MAG: hypothetical protein SGJ09_16150 [Phycisphaerae bacterium]|nr:hypothetical protein [Phycisphaerae bacterium]